jgi:hypothetical protein
VSVQLLTRDLLRAVIGAAGWLFGCDLGTCITKGRRQLEQQQQRQQQQEGELLWIQQQLRQGLPGVQVEWRVLGDSRL